MNRFSRASALVLLAAVLGGCPPAVQPPADGGGMVDTDSGVSCAGQVGCACAAGGVCQTGECLGNVCVDCRRGEAACVCRSNGTCNPGLRCANSRCETCPAEAEGCACGPSGTCATGLTCTNGTCTPSTCTAGTTSCPCRAGDPRCDGADYCDGMSVCRACMPDVAGCACGAGNACGGGLACDPMTLRCRAPVTCAALMMNGTCQVHQLCTQAPGNDAMCVNDCEPGWRWDGTSSTCVACNAPSCATGETCTPPDAGVAGYCASQFRECIAGGPPAVAFCGTCIAGYALNPMTNTCLPTSECGGQTCASTEYCDFNGGNPRCVTSPCPAGQASLDGGACMACAVNCPMVAGQSGRVWPFVSPTTGRCFCATLPGWFLASGGTAQPELCDADGDGWVREEAGGEEVDDQLRANARCTIRRVETVLLRDELKTDYALRSCAAEGLVPASSAPTCAPLQLRLLETKRNDGAGFLSNDPTAPPWGFDGGPGQVPAANTLNSLTKACVKLNSDFNHNGAADIAEVSSRFPPSRPLDRDRLEELAYFVELHSSFYVAPTDGGAVGTLVIQEHSRCDSDTFPLQYPYPDGGFLPLLGADGGRAFEAYAAGVGHSYWRNCSRRTDPAFPNVVGPPSLPGYDFARWNCAVDGGPACSFVPPPHRSFSAPVDPGVNLLRNHGVCEVSPNAPADGRWRGMNHHSQFKCVNVTGTLVNNYDVLPGRFQASGDLVFNQCRVVGAASVTGSSELRPRVECISRPGVPQDVGFASVKYKPYGPAASGYPATDLFYRGGCVNEEVETAVLPPMLPTYGTYLCPWPEYDNVFQSDGGMKARSDRAFGRYSCFGDLPNFLWAPLAGGFPDGGFERATLRWGDDAGSQMFGVLR